MPTAKLTQNQVTALPCPRKGDVFYWDEGLPGFGVRVTEKGNRSFVVQYRTSVGQTRRERLGDVKVLKIEEARTAARTKLAKVQLGADPQADARAARAAMTARDVFEDYLAAVEHRQRPSSHKEKVRALRTYAADLHALRMVGIGRRDIAALLERVGSRHGLITANRVRAHLSAAWTWALRNGAIEGDNPVAYTTRPADEQARARVLTDAELALIWSCTSSGSDFDRIVRLLMLTAQRREEVGAMVWAELRPDGERGLLWTMPRERTKNGREHELPLSPLAVDQLPARERPAKSKSRKRAPITPLASDPAQPRLLVFGRSDGPFSGWSKAKARLDATMAQVLAQQGADLADWRLHDLRRTFATWANEIGYQPHVVEAVLNHVSGARAGVAGVYNRASYRDQKREVLAAWAAHVARIAETRTLLDARAA